MDSFKKVSDKWRKKQGTLSDMEGDFGLSFSFCDICNTCLHRKMNECPVRNESRAHICDCKYYVDMDSYEALRDQFTRVKRNGDYDLKGEPDLEYMEKAFGVKERRCGLCLSCIHKDCPICIAKYQHDFEYGDADVLECDYYKFNEEDRWFDCDYPTKWISPSEKK